MLLESIMTVPGSMLLMDTEQMWQNGPKRNTVNFGSRVFGQLESINVSLNSMVVASEPHAQRLKANAPRNMLDMFVTDSIFQDDKS